MKKGMIILLIISLVILSGLIKVDALNTITPNDYGHKVEYVEYITQLQRTETSGWIKGDFKDFCVGKCYLTKDWYYVKLNQSLNPGITYTWNFNTWITNRDNQDYYNKSNFYMIASNTGKYEGSSSANITNLTCRAGIEEGSTSKVSWSCSFTPTTSINYLYLRITLYEDTDKLFTSYGCNKGSLLNDNAQIDAINNQTGVIKDQTDKINDTLTQDHNYNTNPSESTENEKQQMESYDQEEDNLRNGLDLSIEESEITINPNANNFIWETINKLRGINGKIVLLFTSVLSLGLIKIILGR